MPSEPIVEPLPAPPEPQLVTDQAELERLCSRWLSCSEIGLDTEFVRTRTFYARLGLIQISDPEASYLVDVVRIEDHSCLAEVLVAESVVKVVHSSSEDLEVLFQAYGSFPAPLFDTQIAATLCGFGYSLGYQSLLRELFGLEIPKGETRSNWMKRPLTEAQIRYASLDVAYLLPSHELLALRLRELGRVSWADEEHDRLLTVAKARIDPEWAFSRIKKGRLTVRQLRVLYELCQWREETARRRDLPRSFVASDDTLIALARARPSKLDQLREIRGLHKGELRRSGTEILRRVARGVASERDVGPAARREDGRSKGTVDALKKVVEGVASEQEIPPEFLAQRRVLKDYVRRQRNGGGLPVELQGWRRDLLEEPLEIEYERVVLENDG